jgi:hypothetical protein
VKVSLDEHLPHLLRKKLGNHDVLTVRYKGWAGLKNYELSKTAKGDAASLPDTGRLIVLNPPRRQ